MIYFLKSLFDKMLFRFRKGNSVSEKNRVSNSTTIRDVEGNVVINNITERRGRGTRKSIADMQKKIKKMEKLNPEGFKIKVLTEEEYNALPTKDPETIYLTMSEKAEK